MMSQQLLDEMNLQINKELYSAYLYLAMAAHADAVNLPGFAHWMKLQAQEEMEHALKFYDFINNRGGRVVLEAIEQPQVEFESPLDMFEQTLEHEQYVTSRIHHLYELAVADKDYASQVFLNWFVEEQVEEEASAGEILETLRMVGEKGQALVMLDRQLASRVAE
ncbi:MAG: ferritin [Chloroflexia bacterium]|nr:ferritin [Chloroflexia bacterium]